MESILDRYRRAGVAILFATLGLTPLAAQTADGVVSTRPDPRDPEVELRASAADGVALSLEEAIRIALERNLGLSIQRYERAQFRLMLDENLGIYDLGLSATAWTQEESSPVTSTLEDITVEIDEQSNVNFGARQLSPWGGTGDVLFNVFRRATNATTSLFNPLYAADVDFRLTQPFLRDFGKLATERGILIARLNSGISRENFEDSVADTVRRVIDAYWSLVEAREQIEVSRESLALAEELHGMNRIRVEVGTLAPLELVQSEVGIATRQEEIIRNEATAGDAEDELRRLLNLPPGPLWGIPLQTTTEPEVAFVEVDLATAIDTALIERPELRAQALVVETQRLEAAYFDNQKLPRLDLIARYGYNGTAGALPRPIDDVPEVVIGGLGEALDQITDRQFDGWRVELQFAYPLQNRTARARATRAELDLEQGLVELDQLAQNIDVEVRSAVRAVRTAQQQIESARASRTLAERNLDAERKRYENGLSTSFQVLEIQEDLTAARSREVASITAYRRALARLEEATGRLLAQHDIEIVDPLAAEDEKRFGWGVAAPAEGYLPGRGAAEATEPAEAQGTDEEG